MPIKILVKGVSNLELYKEFSLNGTLPVVLKPTNGFGSRGLFKCDSESEFIKALENINEEYCISSYYEHLTELRFIVLNGKFKLFYPKYFNPANKFQPEIRDDIKIPLKILRELKKEAEEASKILDYKYMAVDFLIKEDDWILLECNGNPNLISMQMIKTLEKLSNYLRKY